MSPAAHATSSQKTSLLMYQYEEQLKYDKQRKYDEQLKYDEQRKYDEQLKHDEQRRYSSPSPAAKQSPNAKEHQSRLLSETIYAQSTFNYADSSAPAVEADAAAAMKIAALQTAAEAVDQAIQEKKRAMAATAALLASGDTGRAQAVDSDAYVAALQDLLQQLKQLEHTKQKLQDAVSRLQQGYSISGGLPSSTGMSVLGEHIYAGAGVARTAQRTASPADAATMRSSLRKASINDSPAAPAASPSPSSRTGPQRTVSFKGYNFNDGALPPPLPPPAQDTEEVLKPSNSSRSYHGSSLTRRGSHSPDHERAAEAAAATAADGSGDGGAPIEGYANIWTAQRSRATSAVGGLPAPTCGRSGGGSYRDAYALYTSSKRSLAGSNAGMLQQGLGHRSTTGDGVSLAKSEGFDGHTSMHGSHRRSSAASGDEQQRHQPLQEQDTLLGSASRSLMLNRATSSIRSRASGSVASANMISPTKVGANAGARQWHETLRTSPGSTISQQQQRQGQSVTPERSITPSTSFNGRSGVTTPERSLTPQRSITPERVYKTPVRSPWSAGTAAAAGGGRYGKLATWTAGSHSSSKKLGAQRLGGTPQHERDSAAQHGVRQRSRPSTRSPRTTGPASAAATAPAGRVGSVYSDSPINAKSSRRVTGQSAVERHSTAEQQVAAPQQQSGRVLQQQQQQYHSPPRTLSQQQQQSYIASNYGGESSARGTRVPSVAYPAEGFFLSREASTAAAAAGIASPRGSPRNSSSSDPKMLQLMQVLADFQAGEIAEQDLRASLELVLMAKGGQQDMFLGSQNQQMLQQLWGTGGLSPVSGMSPRSSLSPGRGVDNPLDRWQAWQQQQQQQHSGGGASSMSPSRQSSRPNSMFGRQLSKMLSLVQDLSASGGNGGSADKRVHESNFTVYSRG